MPLGSDRKLSLLCLSYNLTAHRPVGLQGKRPTPSSTVPPSQGMSKQWSCLSASLYCLFPSPAYPSLSSSLLLWFLWGSFRGLPKAASLHSNTEPESPGAFFSHPWEMTRPFALLASTGSFLCALRLCTGRTCCMSEYTPWSPPYCRHPTRDTVGNSIQCPQPAAAVDGPAAQVISHCFSAQKHTADQKCLWLDPVKSYW